MEVTINVYKHIVYKLIQQVIEGVYKSIFPKK